jgi:hypothetical protein
VGRNNSVCIATRCGLEGPGIESWKRRDFPHPSRHSLGPTKPPCAMSTVSSPGGGRSGRGMAFTTHPQLAPKLKIRTIHLLPFWVSVACSRVTFIFTKTLRFWQTTFSTFYSQHTKTNLPSINIDASLRANLASYSVGVKWIFLPGFEQLDVKLTKTTLI